MPALRFIVTKDYPVRLYIATYWTGAGWADLHPTPLPFSMAQHEALSALLAGHGTTRLRII